MEVNDIVTVIAFGNEYVGKFVESDDSKITLAKPVMLMLTEQGMGFTGSVAMSGEENPKQVTLHNYQLVTKTNPQIATAYRKHTSGLIDPSAGGNGLIGV
jgi:hypothetical protein